MDWIRYNYCWSSITKKQQLSGAIEQIENDAREITKRMKPARIEGASFVNLLPKNEGAMKYNYQVVTDEGVWFSRSNYIGMMGKPAKTNRWPKEAVLVPTQIYKVCIN